MRLFATPGGLPRVSWGAVIAGVILSLIVYLVLSVLGTAIGATLLSPMSQPNPMQGFGIGSGVWMLFTTVVAVFTGSYFAGRCAPVLGSLHGLLSWAVMVLLVAFGMATLVGGAVSVAGRVASTSATVGAAAAKNPQIDGSVINSVKEQVQSAVASATSVAISPQAQQDARQAADAAARTVARATWLSFAALVIGAIIALVAGSLGYRHQPRIEDFDGAARDDAMFDTSAARVVGSNRPLATK